jgi:uncharacterized protein (TIGR02246 family)
MESDERAVRELHSTWIDAVNAGDLARLLTSMTDDVVFLNPGQEPVGRAGFPTGFSSAHQRFQIHCTSELEEVVVAGALAHTLSKDTLSLTPRGEGEKVELAGHRISIYRKRADGRWLLARDAHTLSPAAG